MMQTIVKHIKTGGYYRIIAYAFNEADMVPVTVYQKLHSMAGPWNYDGEIFVRPSDEFNDGRFEFIGQFKT